MAENPEIGARYVVVAIMVIRGRRVVDQQSLVKLVPTSPMVCACVRSGGPSLQVTHPTGEYFQPSLHGCSASSDGWSMVRPILTLSVKVFCERHV